MLNSFDVSPCETGLAEMSARFVIDRQIQFAANGVSERCRQWHASKQHQPSTRKALAVPHRKIDCHRPSKPIRMLFRAEGRCFFETNQTRRAAAWVNPVSVILV